MKKYTIKSGNHYAEGFNFGLTTKDTIAFNCEFEPSCLYQLEGEDAYDINKLYGFSGSWNHHLESARVGWRCLDGQNIELLTYYYVNGVRGIGSEKVLGTVKPNERFFCSIASTDAAYVYTFINEDGMRTVISEAKNPDPSWLLVRYTLNFYFGGNRVAPQDMTVKIERVDSYNPFH